MADGGNWRWSVFAGCLAFAGVLLANASPVLPGLHSDGVQYLEAAQSMARMEGLRLPIGDWASADSTSIMAHYPPGFSALMVPFVAAGMTPPLAAVVTIALAAGVAIAFAFQTGWVLSGNLAGAWFAALLIGLNPEWVRLHTAVWSEPVYLALFLASVYTMVRSPERTRLHAFLALACTSVRFVGVSVAGVAAAVAWTQGGSLSDKLKRTTVALAPSILFMVGWTILVHGGGGAVRTAGLYSGWTTWAVRLLAAVPASTAPTGSLPLGLLFLVTIAWVWTLSDLRGSERWRTFAFVAGLGIAFHVVVLGASRLVADPLIPADSRMLAPVLALIGVGAAAALGRACAGPRAARTVVVLLVGCWAAAGAVRIHSGVQAIQDNGQFYTSTVWMQSGLVAWARADARRGGIAYSNEPELIYLYTGRPVREVPVAGEDLVAFREAYRHRQGPIILVNPPKSTDLPVAAIVGDLNLVAVQATPEGIVFSSH